MQKRYTFFTDASHGWLSVPMKEVIQLGIQDKISSYSYMKGEMVYLEEDCDVNLFVNAYFAKFGKEPEFKESNSNSQSIIRRYTSYAKYKPELNE